MTNLSADFISNNLQRVFILYNSQKNAALKNQSISRGDNPV